jgi:hypothetical protein
MTSAERLTVLAHTHAVLPRVRVRRADVAPDPWLVSARQAAAMTGRAVGTIWSWTSRGLVQPVGYVGRTAYYDLSEVMRVERDTRREAASCARVRGMQA